MSDFEVLPVGTINLIRDIYETEHAYLRGDLSPSEHSDGMRNLDKLYKLVLGKTVYAEDDLP